MKRLIRNRTARRSTRDLLAHQIDITIDGVALAQEAIHTPEDRVDARASMVDIEHQGDEARAEVIRVMSSRITTPLDREDLFRASRSIDDVLDNTRDFVREMAMWHAGPGVLGETALEQVVASLEKLRDAVASTNPVHVRENCLAARKEAGQVRRAYQEGLAQIFDSELTMDTLKTRELLRRLDVIGLRLAEGADALLDGLIKRAI
ncbi:DUF47 family protein [Agromyces sp. ISL-38]|uniref:DUF47 domain-containing protein n=1 Tax=Agromyces sp. ISL-38 TaxID=2819107 RepID=UPI001BE9142C|nr:DUF47 family protein [Agromyces sp. ISL-38]MBT2497739.1 DUF47 family protein [Agromyces sp. ISL-38]